MKFIAIIPARYASTRFPGKPLADIGGRPMIQHVYERTREFFDTCCVATDDSRIEDAVRGFGGDVVMTSTEHRSGTDRCAEALAVMEARTGEKFDVVVNIQGDEPFVCSEHLSNIKDAFGEEGVEIATLVKKFGTDEDVFNPNSPKVVVSAKGFAMYFSRSVIPYVRGHEQAEWRSACDFYKHIGLYAYKAATLSEITRLPQGRLEQTESLEQLRWLENGYAIKVKEVFAETVAVDTPEDLDRVLGMLK